MSTNAEARARTKAAAGGKARPRRDPPPLPAGCEALLGKAQICAALGVSLRTFQGMLAAGEYPKADTRLGNFPRWRVETHNAWIKARCGKAEG